MSNPRGGGGVEAPLGINHVSRVSRRDTNGAFDCQHSMSVCLCLCASDGEGRGCHREWMNHTTQSRCIIEQSRFRSIGTQGWGSCGCSVFCTVDGLLL